MRDGDRPQTARDVLNIVDEFLLVDNKESTELFSVLSALRGNDDYSVSGREKEFTTAVIRAAAFPLSARATKLWVNSTDTVQEPPIGFYTGGMVRKDNPTKINLSMTPSGHFKSHTYSAATALNLDVEGDGDYETRETGKVSRC